MKVSAELIEKIKDMLSVYVCPELQQAAKDFLASAEATGEADPANLIAELKDDICTIDDFINFTRSDYCLNMNGEVVAQLMQKQGEEAKANGATTCLCPGCTKAAAILAELTE